MDFHKEVIERSYDTPIVVDFWAPWCGPCRFLGPVIEELAAEAGGQWELVKVNTEEEQQLAMEYGIRSIPNVKMFAEGKIVGEFAGALPKGQIQQWLQDNLPTASAKAWSVLRDTLPGSEPAEQIRLLEEFLVGSPDQPEARLQLAGLKALSDPASALQLLDHVKMGEPGYDLKDDIATIQELGAVSGNGDSLDATLYSAAEALRNNRYADAAEQIIDVVGKDKSIHKELPRRAGVALFHLLGDQHPVTRKYRRIFDMWLY